LFTGLFLKAHTTGLFLKAHTIELADIPLHHDGKADAVTGFYGRVNFLYSLNVCYEDKGSYYNVTT